MTFDNLWQILSLGIGIVGTLIAAMAYLGRWLASNFQQHINDQLRHVDTSIEQRLVATEKLQNEISERQKTLIDQLYHRADKNSTLVRDMHNLMTMHYVTKDDLNHFKTDIEQRINQIAQDMRLRGNR